jgi:hypothetical protein
MTRQGISKSGQAISLCSTPDLSAFLKKALTALATLLCTTGCEAILHHHEVDCKRHMVAGLHALHSCHFADAEKHLLLAVQDARLSKNLLQLPESLNALAMLYEAQKNYLAADDYLTRTKDAYKGILNGSKLGTEDRRRVLKDYADATAKCANLARDSHRFGEAEKLYQEAIAAKKEALCDLDSQKETLDDYASLLRATGRSAQADQLESRLTVELAGCNDLPATFVKARDLALTGKVLEAERLFEIVRQMSIKLNNQLYRLQASDWLAICRLCQGDANSAEKLLTECVHSLEGRSQLSHTLSEMRSLLAYCLEIQGKQSEAAPLYKTPLSLLEVYHFSVVLAESGKTAGHPNLSRWAVSTWERGGRKDTINLARILVELAQYRLSEQFLAKAEDDCNRATSLPAEKRQKLLEVAQVDLLLASCCIQAKDFKTAETASLHALTIYKKLEGERNLDVARAIQQLANTYYYSGDYVNAKQTFRDAHSMFEQLHHRESADAAHSLRFLALCCEYTKQLGEANEYYRRALSIYGKHPDYEEGPYCLKDYTAFQSKRK